jgi:hypothetical protein
VGQAIRATATVDMCASRAHSASLTLTALCAGCRVRQYVGCRGRHAVTYMSQWAHSTSTIARGTNKSSPTLDSVRAPCPVISRYTMAPASCNIFSTICGVNSMQCRVLPCCQLLSLVSCRLECATGSNSSPRTRECGIQRLSNAWA